MNNGYYDPQHLKAIPIVGYLHTTCGIGPVKRYNGYALYHAPYRGDFNTSIRVDFWGNLWHDYGTGQGGSIVDLVMRVRGCGAYGTMKHLAGKRETIIAPLLFHHEDHIGYRRDEQRANNERHILPIGDGLPSHLQRYLREVHKIDLAVASGYFCHIHYKVGGREYSVTGFPNRSGGYKPRGDNASKGIITPKDISMIARREDSVPLCIFEGLMDFLFLLMINGEEAAPCLILSSVSNTSRVIAYLQEQGADPVQTFLDNGPVGRQAPLTIQSSGVTVEDMSKHYARYKDLNEFLVAQRETQKQRIVPRRKGLRR